MLVSDILSQKGRDVMTLPPEANVLEAAVLLSAKHIGALVVRANDGTVAGILSERDVVRALTTETVRALAMPISNYMTAKVATCVETDSAGVLMEMMTKGRFRHVPVVDAAGKLCGLISIGDVVKAHIEETTREALHLREFIAAG